MGRGRGLSLRVGAAFSTARPPDGEWTLLSLLSEASAAIGRINEVDIKVLVYTSAGLVGVISFAKRRREVWHDEDAWFEIAHHAALGGMMALCALLVLSLFSPALGATIIAKEPSLVAASGAVGFFATGRHLLRRV